MAVPRRADFWHGALFKHRLYQLVESKQANARRTQTVTRTAAPVIFTGFQSVMRVFVKSVNNLFMGFSYALSFSSDSLSANGLTT